MIRFASRITHVDALQLVPDNVPELRAMFANEDNITVYDNGTIDWDPVPDRMPAQIYPGDGTWWFIMDNLGAMAFTSESPYDNRTLERVES